MKINEQLVTVTRKIAAEGIGKTRNNSTQGYKFRGVDEVMNAFAPILAEQGLYLRPRFTEREVAERVNKNGTALFYVTVRGEFDFSNDAGETVTVGPFYGEAMDSGDKATNKAMATAFKYAMFQTFCVPLEGVTGGDADMQTHEVATVTRISPNDGVWDGITDERKAQIADIASVAQEYLDSDDIAGARDYLSRSGLEGAEEQTAVMTFFQSYEKAAMKKHRDGDESGATEHLIRNRNKRKAA